MLLQGQIEALEDMQNVGLLVFFLVRIIVKVLFEDCDKKRQVFLTLLTVYFDLLANAFAEVEEELAESQRE